MAKGHHWGLFCADADDDEFEVAQRDGCNEPQVLFMKLGDCKAFTRELWEDLNVMVIELFDEMDEQ